MTWFKNPYFLFLIGSQDHVQILNMSGYILSKTLNKTAAPACYCLLFIRPAHSQG